MRVFVTGASGWIGSAVVADLLAAGHEVVGLARSDASAAALEGRGAAVLRGDLDDLGSLRKGADGVDAVVHLANKHDWANPAASNAAERGAVETFVEALAGTDRPLVLAAGLAGFGRDRPVIETDRTPFVGPDAPRGGAENLALDAVEQGVRTISARFAPTVHGTHDHGFVSYLVAAARERGVSGYVGDGSHRWSAVHVSDAARLVRLGLEQAPAGTALHAAAEEGVPTREIAAAIGRAVGVPVASVDPDDAVDHFGFIGQFFAMDFAASSERTRATFGWEPTGPGLVADIDAGAYTR